MDNFPVTISDFNNNDIDVPILTILTWKYSVKLEMQGLKNSRGSIHRHVCKVLKCKPSEFNKQEMFEYLSYVVREAHRQLREFHDGVIN